MLKLTKLLLTAAHPFKQFFLTQEAITATEFLQLLIVGIIFQASLFVSCAYLFDITFIDRWLMLCMAYYAGLAFTACYFILIPAIQHKLESGLR